jgi:hypothetical protein
MKPSRISILIPVFNEVRTLRELLAQVDVAPVAGLEKELIIVDDGSTDGTREILERLEGLQTPFRVVFHGQNMGKGAAIRTALTYATGDLILVQDADLEYDPRDYEDLVAPILRGRADVVYGSRLRGGKPVRDFSLLYLWGNKFVTLATNVLYGAALTDMDHDRLVAARPVVGHRGGLLVTLHERRVHIEGGRRRRGGLLETRHQRAGRRAQSHEGRGLERDRRLRAGLPGRAVLDVERFQEVPDRGRGRQGIPEQGRQSVILAEGREVLTAVPAARPEGDEALDELRGPQPALPLLHRHLRVDRGGDSELAEQFDHEWHPGPAGDQRGINGLVDLERQPRGRLGHRNPPCLVCTHWVKPSKVDAIGANRLDRRLQRGPLGCSSS